MLTYLVAGFASLATTIIGVRLYNVCFSWGDYKQMIKYFGGNSIKNFTIIITGCNSGIGKETARELFKNGAHIIMANRNQIQTEQLIDEFRKQFPTSTGKLVFKKLDLCSFDSVRKFAKDIIDNESKLDILINNAAVFGAPTQITNDGFEVNLQVNHLAPALLTKLLLPKLQKNQNDELQQIQNSRIVVITSTLTKHGSIDDDLLLKSNDKLETMNKRHAKEIYASSKLANLQFMRCLSNKKNLIKNVDICFASPGFCYTQLHRYSSRTQLFLMSLFVPLFVMIMKSAKQGAQTVIGCSMIKQVRSDVLYHHCKENEMFFKDGILNDSFLAESVYDQTMKAIEK